MPRSRPLLSLLPGWLALASLVCVLVSPAPAAAQTGTVSGTVTNGDTGAPIANLQVAVVTLNGSSVATGLTNGAGEYKHRCTARRPVLRRRAVVLREVSPGGIP